MPRPREMRLRNAGVERQGAFGRCQAVIFALVSAVRVKEACLREPHQGPALRILGVDLGRATAQANDSLLAALVPEVAGDPILPCHEIEVVSFGAIRPTL